MCNPMSRAVKTYAALWHPYMLPVQSAERWWAPCGRLSQRQLPCRSLELAEAHLCDGALAAQLCILLGRQVGIGAGEGEAANGLILCGGKEEGAGNEGRGAGVTQDTTHRLAGARCAQSDQGRPLGQRRMLVGPCMPDEAPQAGPLLVDVSADAQLALLGFWPLWGSSCCLKADTTRARRLGAHARATARPLRACSCRVVVLIIISCRKLLTGLGREGGERQKYVE